ncbi:hypothetical protein Tco_1449850 [Tanacetum coccineum]
MQQVVYTALLPIPLPAPSTSRRADIPEADTPPRKRLLLTTPRPGCEVGESSAAAARQPGPTMAHRVDGSSVDTMETRIRDTERRMMTALEMVNMRKDRAAVRAEIEVLRRERLAYEQEMLETEVHRHEWQRQAADDLAVQHIMRTQALEAGARVDTLEDTASRRYRSFVLSSYPIETEARLSREAWRRSMDASDLARGEVMSLRTTVLGQMSKIRELHAADHRRQAVISEMLKADQRRSAEMRELRAVDRQVAALQGQVTALRGQQGPVRGPVQPELPEEAGSNS